MKMALTLVLGRALMRAMETVQLSGRARVRVLWALGLVLGRALMMGTETVRVGTGGMRWAGSIGTGHGRKGVGTEGREGREEEVWS